MTAEHDEQLGKLKLEMRELEGEWRRELTSIKENHLAHIQNDMNGMRVDLTRVTESVAWLKQYHWLVVGSSIGALITGVFNLI